MDGFEEHPQVITKKEGHVPRLWRHTKDLSVKCYNDVYFTTYQDDCKLQLGFVFIINGVSMSWRISKQIVVAQSTTYSEYIAASESAQEPAWMKKFIGDYRGCSFHSGPPRNLL